MGGSFQLTRFLSKINKTKLHFSRFHDLLIKLSNTTCCIQILTALFGWYEASCEWIFKKIMQMESAGKNGKNYRLQTDYYRHESQEAGKTIVPVATDKNEANETNRDNLRLMVQTQSVTLIFVEILSFEGFFFSK
jgi:hypothetical protein